MQGDAVGCCGLRNMCEIEYPTDQQIQEAANKHCEHWMILRQRDFMDGMNKAIELIKSKQKQNG